MPLVRLMLTIDCGWKKGCTDAELKNAYKKLSLMEPRLLFCIRKLKHVEEAKNKFQVIQEAYSGN
ncbi:putative DnaJ domain-containing protein [Helianthus anomalus]